MAGVLTEVQTRAHVTPVERYACRLDRDPGRKIPRFNSRLQHGACTVADSGPSVVHRYADSGPSIRVPVVWITEQMQYSRCCYQVQADEQAEPQGRGMAFRARALLLEFFEVLDLWTPLTAQTYPHSCLPHTYTMHTSGTSVVDECVHTDRDH